jgi:hypothetical protein
MENLWEIWEDGYKPMNIIVISCYIYHKPWNSATPMKTTSVHDIYNKPYRIQLLFRQLNASSNGGDPVCYFRIRCNL